MENISSQVFVSDPEIKIHRTCPGELDDVVSQLEMLTGSVVVSQIGRTTIIYKPSLTKLKAVEKKKQATRVFMNRAGTTQKPALAMKNGPGSRTTSRAPRGRSRL
ncbi:hypothetical protein SAY86_001256 [Trapa natans]|uniref:CRM domain-containing protein n=1 Tax=Trapa natans TaxID=22666 RepID=A0AAN7M581_TRANT|nr:hypothetical protein SAY86_001256 [Trapa natans]